MEDKLDSLVQQMSKKKRSQVSFKPAECGHHIIRRANELTRWDLDNIVWLTIEEHTKVHSEPNYESKILLNRQKEYKERYTNASLSEYLRDNKTTREEFLVIKFKELTSKVNM